MPGFGGYQNSADEWIIGAARPSGVQGSVRICDADHFELIAQPIAPARNARQRTRDTAGIAGYGSCHSQIAEPVPDDGMPELTRLDFGNRRHGLLLPCECGASAI